eukprot:5795715-Amphidinium_carterae.1
MTPKGLNFLGFLLEKKTSRHGTCYALGARKNLKTFRISSFDVLTGTKNVETVETWNSRKTMSLLRHV